MPLQSPNLDNRTFDELLEEAKRRIPAHTPEWTNFQVESDPGITLVQLFAFLTDNLIYRANRIPEHNRLKFLQLLGVSMRAAAAAQGIITINNEKGTEEPPALTAGIKLAAGKVEFITRDGVSALPLEARLFYKRKLDLTPSDPLYVEWQAKYEAIWMAKRLAGDSGVPSQPPTPAFYETLLLPQPSASDPNPVLDLSSPTVLDNALYVALLAPKTVRPADVRPRIAGNTLSIGIVPALLDAIEPVTPTRGSSSRAPVPRLVYEIVNPSATTSANRYQRLLPAQEPDVLSKEGIVQVKLPAADKLKRWDFAEPQEEGTDNYPPLIEDDEIQRRLVTWIRLRAPSTPEAAVLGTAALPKLPTAEGALATKQPKVRISWVGINAVRITQAVAVHNELLGTGSGEPDQELIISNTPVIARSVRLEIETAPGTYESWRETDDLLSAAMDQKVFAVDPESGGIRFGTGLRGARPLAGRRIRASYQYGGGRQGNVPIGAVNRSPDPKWPSGLKLQNPLATWGGDEGETIAEAERNIPLVLRHRDRLVTENDFRNIARRLPGVDVGRVDVLPLFRPGDAGQPDQKGAAGVVTLMVLPKFDSVHPLWPQPDRLFLRTVCDYLAPRRLVTTELHVRGPVYLPVYLSVGVRIEGGHFPDVVVQQVRKRLNEYLSALCPGGPDGEQGDGWPLYEALLKKDLEAVVTRVRGVNFVESMELGVKGQRGIEQHLLTGLQLPKLVVLQVREGLAEPLANVLDGTDTSDPQVDVFPVPVNRLNC